MEALAYFPEENQLQEQTANLEALAGQFIGFLDVSPKSMETYRASIRRLMEYLRSRNITHPTRADILQYRERMKRDYKPASISLHMTACRLFSAGRPKRGYIQM